MMNSMVYLAFKIMRTRCLIGLGLSEDFAVKVVTLYLRKDGAGEEDHDAVCCVVWSVLVPRVVQGVGALKMCINGAKVTGCLGQRKLLMHFRGKDES